jgi:hypothetical protein
LRWWVVSDDGSNRQGRTGWIACGRGGRLQGLGRAAQRCRGTAAESVLGYTHTAQCGQSKCGSARGPGHRIGKTKKRVRQRTCNKSKKEVSSAVCR